MLRLHLEEIKIHLRSIDPSQSGPLITDKGLLLTYANDIYKNSVYLQGYLESLKSSAKRIGRSRYGRNNPQIMSMKGLARKLQKELTDIQGEMMRVLGLAERDLARDVNRWSSETEVVGEMVVLPLIDIANNFFGTIAKLLKNRKK
jgi:hypothetical protein